MLGPRTILTVFATAIALSSSGCVKTVEVLQTPAVTEALKWAGKETFKIVLTSIVVPAMYRAFRSAEAATSAPDRCDSKPDLAACSKAAQGASGVIAEEALRDVIHLPEGSLSGVQIRCNQDETRSDCSARFQTLLAAAYRNHSAELPKLLKRAQDFADAWPVCQSQVHDDTTADDQHKIMNAIDACLSDHGFGAEIQAIRLIYSSERG